MATVAAGKSAPAFELAATNGKTYSLREALNSGPLLAAFLKVSCPTCQYTFPFLERLHQQLRSAGAAKAQVWGIAQNPAPHARDFTREYGVTFPMLIDDEPFEISRAYALTIVPSIFLITSDGRVQVASDGFCKADLLEIHRSLAALTSASLPPLFQPREQVPEFKPG